MVLSAAEDRAGTVVRSTWIGVQPGRGFLEQPTNQDHQAVDEDRHADEPEEDGRRERDPHQHPTQSTGRRALALMPRSHIGVAVLVVDIGDTIDASPVARREWVTRI